MLGDFLTMDRSSFGYRRPALPDDDDSNGLSNEESYDADHVVAAAAAAMQNEEQIRNDRVVCLSLQKFR